MYPFISKLLIVSKQSVTANVVYPAKGIRSLAMVVDHAKGIRPLAMVVDHAIRIRTSNCISQKILFYGSLFIFIEPELEID